MKTLNEITSKHTKPLFFCMIAILFFLPTEVYSITITTPGPPTCVVAGEVGTPIPIVTLSTDVPGNNWNEEGITVVSFLSDIGLSLSPTGQISGTPTVAGTYDLYVSVLDASDSDQMDDAYVRICITRPAVDVMLVLDRSGSMSQFVPGLSMNKWGVLKASVETFLQRLDNWGASGDQVGAVYFDHTREDYLVGGSPGLHPFVDETAIMTQLNTTISPSGWTCIGGGILAAYDAFGSNPYRHIVLFSDGIQNRDPSYDMATKIIADHNVFTDWTGTTTTPSLNMVSPPNQFKIHSIAIGDNAVTSRMQDIAMANSNPLHKGGYLHLNSTSNLYNELHGLFSETFIGMMADFSPALTNRKILEITGNEEEYPGTSFRVNNSADKIMITAIGEPGDLNGLEMNVRKGTFSFSNYIEYDDVRIVFFADKMLLDSLGVSIGGQWDVNFSGRRNVRISVDCMINDELVNYNAVMGDGNVEPGDPLELILSADILGKPITNLTQAQVIVLKPGQDLNDLFSTANSNIDPPSNWTSEPGVNPGQDMYEKLIALDTSFINALIPVEHIHNLNNNGDGTYSFVFNDTEESGLYKAIFFMRGSTPEQGEIERFKIRTRVIDFGIPDEGNTTFNVQNISGSSTFIITPKNKFGHLIGPNRLNQIKLLLDNKRVQLTDNLDGTYQAVVKRGFFKPNPSIKLDIKQTDYTQMIGIALYADVPGANVTLLDKIKPWVIIVIIIILVIIGLIRRGRGGNNP